MASGSRRRAKKSPRSAAAGWRCDPSGLAAGSGPVYRRTAAPRPTQPDRIRVNPSEPDLRTSRVVIRAHSLPFAVQLRGRRSSTTPVSRLSSVVRRLRLPRPIPSACKRLTGFRPSACGVTGSFVLRALAPRTASIQHCFPMLIHQESVIKVDCIVRKDGDFGTEAVLPFDPGRAGCIRSCPW